MQQDRGTASSSQSRTASVDGSSTVGTSRRRGAHGGGSSRLDADGTVLWSWLAPQGMVIEAWFKVRWRVEGSGGGSP
eukprot:365662-Chlamydomonas_euryale.AAC.10